MRRGPTQPSSAAGPAGYLRRVSGAQLAHELGTAFFERQQLSAAMADTFLEHLCLLDIDSEPVAARSTCIIATIGKQPPPPQAPGPQTGSFIQQILVEHSVAKVSGPGPGGRSAKQRSRPLGS